ncbi:hypothetical protein V9L05_20475 [Bernardetia sp. Wsw4-3y2]|uniref:hypothetical protein n=1 Tax=Bernardetia sp. Wsw4-3y2 TaxID=3127471 RepID=UPI0030CB30EA
MSNLTATPTFTSTNEAFTYFIENIYPNLPSEEIRKIKHFIYDFRKKRGISENKMVSIMENYGKAEVKKIIEISF